MNRSTRDVETKTTHAATNTHHQDVHDGEADLSWGREPLAIIDVQPVDARKTITEPTGEEGADQTQQVAEHGDRIGNDPGDDPARHTNRHPGSNGGQVAAVHAVGSAEDADVDVL